MATPTVLLLASTHDLADRMTALLRDGGFEVVPGWFHDAPNASAAGAPVDLVLVDLAHHAARSPAFTRMAAQLGVSLAYFQPDAGIEPDALAEPLGADGSAPVLHLRDDGAQLLAVLRRLVLRER